MQSLHDTGRASHVLQAVFFATLTGLAGSQSLAQGTWEQTGSMTEPRRDHTATLLQDGRVLIVGPTASAELYNPETGSFSLTDSPSVAHGPGATATLLRDDRVLIVGGRDAADVAEVYDPVAETFQLVDSLLVEHRGHTATLLWDGMVLIAAGKHGGSQAMSHAVAELFDPVTESFSPTGDLNADRVGHTATALPDGRVLITSGALIYRPGVGYALRSAELYDPAAQTFTLTGETNFPRTSHSATLLNTGRVLISGGGGRGLATVEVYDPATGGFQAEGDMTAPRSSHSATLLRDGSVLLAGGSVDLGPVTTNSAEIYDPAAGTFTATLPMMSARQTHEATLLGNGRVLLSGGSDGSAATATAVLFVPPAMACDADGDGYIDYADALAVIRYLRAGGELLGNGDCNQDGVIDFRDVRAILKSIRMDHRQDRPVRTERRKPRL